MKQETYICNSDQCEPYFTKGKEYERDNYFPELALVDNNYNNHVLGVWKDRFTLKQEPVNETDLDKAKNRLDETYKAFLQASEAFKKATEVFNKLTLEMTNTQ